jgi:hypothetical protein
LTVDDGQRLEDGRWSALAMRDKEVVIAIANRREEARQATFAMMVTLSLETP